MSSGRKTLLGILSFLPAILGIVWIVYFFINWQKIIIIGFHPEANPDVFVHHFFNIILTGMAILIPSGILSISLVIYYIIHIINHQKGTEQIVWILVMLLAGVIGFPLYWFMNIKSERSLQKEVQLPI